jgi:hypothetical protein
VALVDQLRKWILIIHKHLVNCTQHCKFRSHVSILESCVESDNCALLLLKLMYDIISFNTVCYETFEEILFLISEPHLTCEFILLFGHPWWSCGYRACHVNQGLRV